MADLGIEWETFTETARIPTRQDGIHFIFKSDEYVTIPPGHTVSISTNVGFRMPNNVGGLIYPFGGFLSLYFLLQARLPTAMEVVYKRLIAKSSNTIPNVFIPARFLADTGGSPFQIKLWNFGHQPIHIQRGTNICKMMCQGISSAEDLTFTKLNEQAFDPIRNAGSPGWILRSPRDCTIDPNGSEAFLTGVSTSGIQGYNAYVYPYHEFSTSNYLISDPRKDLEVWVTNCTNESIYISRGDNLGLVAVNQALHVNIDVVEFEFQQPPGPRTARG